jgi:hypothetical protein
MQVDIRTFLTNTLELKNSTIPVQPNQSESTTRKKSMIIDDPREDDKPCSRALWMARRILK